MSTEAQCPSCHSPLPIGISDGMCALCISQLLAGAGGRRTHKKSGKWPRRFGEYELLEKVGMGGMGIVFKARQRQHDRVVALKMIRRNQFAGEHEIQRFRSETKAIAKLDHPHIIPLYEVGKHRGRHFFSMLLVESGSLMTHLPRLSKDPRKSAQIMAIVARAVHYAHQHCILHRDLKPANILLDAQDQPYVSDFGLAKKVDDEFSMTQTGAVLGTPSYMAPEQAAGKHGKGSPAADVYSLGAILYELLTGQPPFAAETALATLKLLQEQDPRPPRSINRKIHRDLETICLKCLQKDPQKRYSTAEALALDLESFMREEPIDARPVGQIAEAVKWARCRPILAGSLAAGALLLLITTIASISMAMKFGAIAEPPHNDPPVVVFMDTSVQAGVYKNKQKNIIDAGTTNADVLYHQLSDLRITPQIERIPSHWDREMKIVAWYPDLVVIHRSAFFHAFNAGVEVGKRPENGFSLDDDPLDILEDRWQALYHAADDHLILFLGTVGMESPRTKFLVYSRGTGGDWKKPEFRKDWVHDLELRFPKLRGRVSTMFVDGGLEGATFDADSANAAEIRKQVQQILGLDKKKP